jgi:predicted choloylglycine hydrolase
MPIFQSYCFHLTGTPFEKGKALGDFIMGEEVLSKNLRERLRWYDTYDRDLIDIEKVNFCEELVQKRLPSLLDEIKGFTETVRISYEKYLYFFMFDWEIQSHCSQFCVLPEITTDHKAYSGHSWEWTMDSLSKDRIRTLEEDNVFIVYKESQCAWMGFSLNLFGFWNGMNEHGVSVNPTGGIPIPESSERKRFYHHGLLVRMILETCQSAESALELVKELLPLSHGGGTLILSDSTGKSYYIERADYHFEVLEVGKDTAQKYQCAANHFVNPRMFPYMSQKGVHSILRYKAMNTWMEAHQDRLNLEQLLELQKQPFPDGPCCHFYQEYLGTCHSVVFNLTDRKAMVCFGSPRLNPWYEYDFKVQESGMQKIMTKYINEKADPQIWKHIGPEEGYP